ncbi:MAG: porin [Bacteroidota bacterium]|nr:porin [Bacteroidota bacterium]
MAQENERDSTSWINAIQHFIGQFQPRPGIMAQFGADVKVSEDKTTSDFLIRNLRVYLIGSTGSNFSYLFQGDLNGWFRLLGLKLSYRLNDNFKIEGGRFKTPFGVEFLKNDAKLLFMKRSIVATIIGPLRQHGLQLQSLFFDKRLTLTTGVFNGDTVKHRREISLFVGKIQTTPIKKNEVIQNLQLELGGSIAYTNDRHDLLTQPFVEKNIILYGFNSRITYDSYWLECEYDAASSNNLRTRDGFYLDGGWKIASDMEAAIRFDWYSNYYFRLNEPIGIYRKYIIGMNYYPLDRIKLQLMLERDQTNKVNACYLNCQYAVNFE